MSDHVWPFQQRTRTLQKIHSSHETQGEGVGFTSHQWQTISNNISVRIAIKREHQTKICSQGSHGADSKLWIPRAMINPWRYCCLTSYQSFLSPAESWVPSKRWISVVGPCVLHHLWSLRSHGIENWAPLPILYNHWHLPAEPPKIPTAHIPWNSHSYDAERAFVCAGSCHNYVFPKIRIINFFISLFSSQSLLNPGFESM